MTTSPSPRLRVTIALVLSTLSMSAVAVLAGLQTGCDKTQEMVSAPGVPASEGTLKASRDPNGNTRVTIQVKHLAQPAKLAPDATVYVVWFRPRLGAAQNMGALVLGENLQGRLDTVTSHREFQVTVTPEVTGQAEQPTHEAVLLAEVARAD